MKPAFCPKCGKSKKKFLGALCEDCFLASKQLVLVPDALKATQCKQCGKLLLDGKWHAFSLDILEHWVKGKIKTKELDNVRIAVVGKPLENDAVLIAGEVVGELQGVLVKAPVQVTVALNASLCADCSKVRADYYESTIQLRFDSLPKGGPWLQVLDFVKQSVAELFVHDSLAQVSQVVRLKNGFDVYIGSKRAGKTVSDRLAKKWNGKVTRSFSLAGVDKSGKTRKRFTFLVRL